MSAPSIVAIVPARGGSKSIPRKNIRSLAGVPLIAYSIEAGLSARSVQRVIVSTDDEEIAAVAREYGADVPFMRPAELAGDHTPDLPVFDHAIDWLRQAEGRVPDIVVQLRPTSPVRPVDCVDRAVELLVTDPDADSVRAVAPAGQNPFKMWRFDADGLMRPLVPTDVPEPYNQPRQLLPAAYWQTGHVDAIRVATILEKRSLTGERIRPLVVDAAYACDIDTEGDWRRTEWQIAQLDNGIVLPRSRAARLPADVQIVIFDFDGVMTDNRVWVEADGRESVACDRSDGLGIERLRALGIPMMVLSTETHPVVAARCRKLGLPCVHGVADKSAYLDELVRARGYDLARIVYVGNDTNDVACLRRVGCGVVVADAHPDARAVAGIVLSRPGGHGAVREVCDRIAQLKAPDLASGTR